MRGPRSTLAHVRDTARDAARLHGGRDPDRGAQHARLLIGSGRSGTTWLLQEMTRLTAARPVFEPFHPIDVPRSSEVVPRGYLPRDAEAPALERHVADVLGGGFRAPWTEQCNPAPYLHRYRGRVVKEVHTHLWAGWLQARFPEVPIAVVVRHPFAQVGSRSALAWSDRKLDLIVADADLVDAHAPELPALVADARTPLERGVLLWAIDNRVLLRTLTPGSPFLFGYEDAVADPAVVGDLLEHFGFPRPASRELAHEARGVASLMSQPGAPRRAAADANAKWLDGADPAAVGRALASLEALGFGDVFDARGGTDIGRLRERAAGGLA
ncbi:hypothetical protein QQX10_12760 [Demequina sp. SYSU T00039]|uniref:Sulfotransferase family protein n=1 Tax=Demequina lignilytica TaxID=3051663 RepID=A0AAW7M6E9_9MICO|nr:MULTISPECIES: hypothetical protein [unclassified Demequina]MDN4479043.1 hypothetical protein [Demequina sp. SYSU T00039-1]MDN4489038.1 hypothetical protein [Demequina sp. SYSU T00039]